MVSIFSTENYREYIREYQHSLPKRGWGFVGRLAEELGVTQVQISQVLGGKKDFTLEQAVQVGEFLSLNALEQEYFLWLVIRSRSGSLKLNRVADDHLGRLREKSNKLNVRVEPDRKLNAKHMATFYSHFLYSAIRLYTSIGAGKTIDEIVDYFHVSRQRALSIVDFLVESGLCRLNGNLYSMGDLRTGVGRDSLHLIRHHTNFRLLALHTYDQLKENEIMMTTNVSLSRHDFVQIRDKLMGEIEAISKRVRASDPEMIACWNMDWFELKP